MTKDNNQNLSNHIVDINAKVETGSKYKEKVLIKQLVLLKFEDKN